MSIMPGMLPNISSGPNMSSSSKPGNNKAPRRRLPDSVISSSLSHRTRAAGESGRLAMEAFAIVDWHHAQVAQKGPAHLFGGSEATAAGHLFEAEPRILEPAPRRVEAGPLDELRRRRSGLTPEDAREVARAHDGARRQPLDRKIGPEVGEDPFRQIAQRTRRRALGGEVAAELRLPAGPLEEHDQLAR